MLGAVKYAVLIMLGMIEILFCINGYDELDSKGFVVHHKTVDLYMSNDWLVGENRRCFVTPESSSDGRVATFSTLTCSVVSDRTTPHNLSIAFWGRIKSPDINGAKVAIQETWMCTRESDSFVCKIPK